MPTYAPLPVETTPNQREAAWSNVSALDLNGADNTPIIHEILSRWGSQRQQELVQFLQAATIQELNAGNLNRDSMWKKELLENTGNSPTAQTIINYSKEYQTKPGYGITSTRTDLLAAAALVSEHGRGSIQPEEPVQACLEHLSTNVFDPNQDPHRRQAAADLLSLGRLRNILEETVTARGLTSGPDSSLEQDLWAAINGKVSETVYAGYS